MTVQGNVNGTLPDNENTADITVIAVGELNATVSVEELANLRMQPMVLSLMSFVMF